MFPALALGRALAPRGRAVALLTDSRGARYVGGELPFTVVSAGSPSGGPRRTLARARRSWRAACSRACWRCAAPGRWPPPRFGGYASVPAALGRGRQPRAAPGPRAERRVRPRQPADRALRRGPWRSASSAPPTCRPGPGCGGCSPATRRARSSSQAPAARRPSGPLPRARAGRQPGCADLQRRRAGGPGAAAGRAARAPRPRPAVPARGSGPGRARPMPALGLRGRARQLLHRCARRGWRAADLVVTPLRRLDRGRAAGAGPALAAGALPARRRRPPDRQRHRRWPRPARPSLVPQPELTAERLAAELAGLMRAPDAAGGHGRPRARELARPDAVERLLDAVLALAGERRP